MAKRCTSFFHFGFLLSLAMVVQQLVEGLEATLPPVFIFGDSTFDVGTNDYIPECLARADFLYNGIDFPNSVPTGRFSNGLNSADHIARLLGYRMSPLPYFLLVSRMHSFRAHILDGVNFASGGSGILNTTGFQPYVKVISLEEQITQFATVCTNLTAMLGSNITAAEKLSKSLFLISVGSNDIFDYENYNNTTESATELLDNLLSTYQIHLTRLYDLGARKFGIVSVPPLGCCPAARLLNITHGGPGGCLDAANDIAQAFYTATADLLQNFSTGHADMKYSLGNAYEMTMQIMSYPEYASIKELETACCGGGKFNGQDPCNRTATLCPDRNDYLFWDRYHPTDKIAHLAAIALYNGSLEFVTPMNFSRLALINL